MKTTTVHGKPAIKIVRGDYRGQTARLFKLMDNGRTQQAVVIFANDAQRTIAGTDWVYVR